MVTNTVLLFETRFMRLVDDDKAKIGKRQEQGRARTDQYLGAAIGDSAPGAATLGRAEIGMPNCRFDAKTRGKAFQERCGQGDFREQYQHLPAEPDRLGDCLEIGLGFA